MRASGRTGSTASVARGGLDRAPRLRHSFHVFLLLFLLSLTVIPSSLQDVKWRNITFMTSRQGMGVTGGACGPAGEQRGHTVMWRAWTNSSALQAGAHTPIYTFTLCSLTHTFTHARGASACYPAIINGRTDALLLRRQDFRCCPEAALVRAVMLCDALPNDAPKPRRPLLRLLLLSLALLQARRWASTWVSRRARRAAPYPALTWCVAWRWNGDGFWGAAGSQCRWHLPGSGGHFRRCAELLRFQARCVHASGRSSQSTRTASFLTPASTNHRACAACAWAACAAASCLPSWCVSRLIVSVPGPATLP